MFLQNASGRLLLFLWKVFWKYSGNLQENAHLELLCSFIEITLPHGCSLVNLLHIFRACFYRNNSGRMLVKLSVFVFFVLGFQPQNTVKILFMSLRKLCQNTGFLWSVFFCIRTLFCPYREKYWPEKTPILVYFRQFAFIDSFNHFYGYNHWNLRFCPHKGKYRSEKTLILAHFRQCVFTDSFNHPYGYYRWNNSNTNVIWFQLLATDTSINLRRKWPWLRTNYFYSRKISLYVFTF